MLSEKPRFRWFTVLIALILLGQGGSLAMADGSAIPQDVYSWIAGTGRAETAAGLEASTSDSATFAVEKIKLGDPVPVFTLDQHGEFRGATEWIVPVWHDGTESGSVTLWQTDDGQVELGMVEGRTDDFSTLVNLTSSSSERLFFDPLTGSRAVFSEDTEMVRPAAQDGQHISYPMSELKKALLDEAANQRRNESEAQVGTANVTSVQANQDNGVRNANILFSLGISLAIIGLGLIATGAYFLMMKKRHGNT